MNLLIDGKKKDEAKKFLPKLNSELMKIVKSGIVKKKMPQGMYQGLLKR